MYMSGMNLQVLGIKSLDNLLDIIIRVNGDKEFKAKVLGSDPLSDIAVLQLETDEKFISNYIPYFLKVSFILTLLSFLLYLYVSHNF